jgi:hypothetical protein
LSQPKGEITPVMNKPAVAAKQMMDRPNTST